MGIFSTIRQLVRQSFIRMKRSNLFKGFAVTTLGSGISKAIMIAATFYCTHTLTQTEFGEFSFINNTLVMILTICASNFSRLCTKFATEAKNSSESIQRLFILFLFSLIACVLASVLILALPDTVLESVFGDTSKLSFLRFSALLLPLFMLHPLIEGIFRGLFRFTLISIIQILIAALYLVGLIVGIYLDGLDGAIWALMIYYSIFSVCYLICLLKIVPLSSIVKSIRGFVGQMDVMHKMILPVFIASFIEAPMFWLLQLMLTKYSSVASVGGMTVMKQVRNFALLIPNYFFNTYIAFAGRMNAERRYAEYFSKFDRLIKYFFLIGLGFFLLFSILSKPILWLYRPEYVADWRCLVISNAILPLSLVLSLVKTDLILQEHQRALLIISLIWNLAWVALFMVFVYLKIMPLEAFFYGELFANGVQLLFCYIIYRRDRVNLLKQDTN